MEVNLLGFDSHNIIETVSVKEELFGLDYSPEILSFVVNWQLAKRRGGNHKTKTISEVSGTTRKPYKQKGTGRARQGSLRSAQFRGGGIIFGPVVRSHAFKVNKKVRKLAVKMALSLKCSSQSLSLLKAGGLPEAKTSNFVSWLKKHENLASTESLLIISGSNDQKLISATRNLHKVKYLDQCAVNVYDLLKYEHVLIDQGAIENLESRFL